MLVVFKVVFYSHHPNKQKLNICVNFLETFGTFFVRGGYICSSFGWSNITRSLPPLFDVNRILLFWNKRNTFDYTYFRSYMY